MVEVVYHVLERKLLSNEDMVPDMAQSMPFPALHTVFESLNARTTACLIQYGAKSDYW